MLKNQSIEIIKTFSAKEEKEFLKFLSSPVFNRSEKLVKLYSVLLKNKHKFDNPLFTKEYVFKCMKINSPYNDSTMRNLFADLHIMLKKYLSFIGYMSTPNKKEIFLLRESISRKLNKEIIETLEILKSDNTNFENQSFEKFLDFSEIKDIEFRHFYVTQSKFNRKNIELGELLLNDTVFYLFLHMLYKTIMYENDYIVMTNIFSNKPKNSELHKLYEIISKINLYKIFSENDVSLKYINLLLNITNAFINPDDTGYYKIFKSEFEELKNKIPARIDYDLCKLATYYNEYKIIRDADSDSIRDAFYFLKRIIENKLYLHSELRIINHFLFRSVAANGANNGEFEWVQCFISDYSDILKPQYRKDTLNLSYGNLFFAKKDYQSALKFLNDMNTENRVFNAEAKVLILKIHFESGQFESLKYAIDSYYKLFKYEETFGDFFKQSLLKFVFYLKKLYIYKTTLSGKDNLMYIFDKLQKDKNVLNKNWLIEKFDSAIGGT